MCGSPGYLHFGTRVDAAHFCDQQYDRTHMCEDRLVIRYPSRGGFDTLEDILAMYVFRERGVRQGAEFVSAQSSPDQVGDNARFSTRAKLSIRAKSSIGRRG